MGIPVKNPLVVGACSLTGHMDSIRRVADRGAGALVIQSLFEEQIQLEKYKLEEDIQTYDDWHAEMQDIFPEVEHGGPEEHLMWVRKAVEALDIPVIASLNCLNPETWTEWAKRLAETGCHGLELNFFALPADREQSADQLEQEQIDIVSKVKGAVNIPVSVKLSAFYTSPINVITRMGEAGADGVVLFNRMFHPSIDTEGESMSFPFNLSHPSDHRLPLRFVGLLAGRTNASLCASNGIHSGEDALEVLLAGADVFQVVSTLYRNSPDVIVDILNGIESWMKRKGYETLDEFRGKLSAQRNPDRLAYRRVQYVQMLLRSDDYIKRPKLI
jgi:dihydroorotate dehydrogenase (fumarate)